MVNHIDDSRERPETAVSDNSGNKGEEPGRAIAEKGKGHAEHDTTSRDLAKGKNKKKHRRDPKHTRLSSAINRAADKGDAER